MSRFSNSSLLSNPNSSLSSLDVSVYNYYAERYKRLDKDGNVIHSRSPSPRSVFTPDSRDMQRTRLSLQRASQTSSTVSKASQTCEEAYQQSIYKGNTSSQNGSKQLAGKEFQVLVDGEPIDFADLEMPQPDWVAVCISQQV